jgi:hypothetical protein
MKITRTMKLYFLVITGILVYPVYAQDASSIYQTAVRSTVTIKTNNGTGSGFFIGNHMLITCFHVIEGSNEVYFYTNNSEVSYPIEEYVKVDVDSDLILLSTGEYNGTPLKVSIISPKPGQKVYTIGSPLGWDFSISDGIVSGLRKINGIELIQITAPISPGNSGGPVLDQFGALLGVSVGNIPDAQNLNFCIPKSRVESLLSFSGHNPRPLSTLQRNSNTSQRTRTRSTIKKPVYEDSVILNALIIYAFPLVLDKVGTSLQIDARGEKVEYGEYVYFYAVDLKNPRLLAYGSVSGINGNRCNIEILESISEFNDHDQYLILFDHELE